jgi:hypothetical protein
MKLNIEDGLYRAQAGDLVKLYVEDDGTKKIRVADDVFRAVQQVQRRLRRQLGGRKPDLGLVAEALLWHAAKQEGIEGVVREYAIGVFSGAASQPEV